MAFRKYLADRPDLLASMQAAEQIETSARTLGVLGLTNAYHGDTLGTMDAVAPSPYNGLQQTPWYAACVKCSTTVFYCALARRLLVLWHCFHISWCAALISCSGVSALFAEEPLASALAECL